MIVKALIMNGSVHGLSTCDSIPDLQSFPRLKLVVGQFHQRLI